MSVDPKTNQSFWSRPKKPLAIILRYILILALLAGIAAAIYFGAPYLYEKFILPVESNTARLSEIESKQATEVEQLNAQIAELKSRLADLETRQTTSALAVAEAQGQIAALETAVEAHSETLKQLEVMQAALDSLSLASDNYESLLVGDNSALAEVQRQVTQSRSIELLSRARLYLFESNFGLAKADVQAAYDLLSSLQNTLPSDQNATLQDVLARLDLALENLPSYPVIAADDVDIAWQILVDGLPTLPGTTVTPEPTSEAPLSTEEATPTVTP
jgi:predicted RNase H-like nuclease (RuvC/YqgF family)